MSGPLKKIKIPVGAWIKVMLFAVLSNPILLPNNTLEQFTKPGCLILQCQGPVFIMAALKKGF